MENSLPLIPAKRYFTIGEVADLCGVKPHVLRYWEQEFTQLRPMKRRGNRRYYQHHEVLMVRRIRELLYDQGFTISGARNKMLEMGHGARDHSAGAAEESTLSGLDVLELDGVDFASLSQPAVPRMVFDTDSSASQLWHVRQELCEIRALLD